MRKYGGNHIQSTFPPCHPVTGSIYRPCHWIHWICVCRLQKITPSWCEFHTLSKGHSLLVLHFVRESTFYQPQPLHFIISILCGLSQHVLLYGRVSDPSAYLLSLSFTVNPFLNNMHFRDHLQGNFYLWRGIRNRYQNYSYIVFQEQLKNCALSSSTVHHNIISNASNRSLTFVLWPHYSRYLSGRVARHSTLKSSVWGGLMPIIQEVLWNWRKPRCTVSPPGHGQPYTILCIPMMGPLV